MFTPAQVVHTTHSPATTPSPTWGSRFPPSGVNGGLPHHQRNAHSTNQLPNGTATEEAAVAQPTVVRQGRGARLSFLGGRKKDHNNHPTVNGGGGDHHTSLPATQEEPQHQSVAKSASGSSVATITTSKEGAAGNTNRRSFFRLPQGQGQQQGHAHSPSERTVVQTNGTLTDVYATTPGGHSDWSGDGALEKGSHRVFVETHHGHHEVQAHHHGHGGVGNSVRKRLSLLRLGKKSSKGGPGGLGGVDEE